MGSIISATAPESWVLILGRAILGLGAAGLLQGALAIIGFVVPLGKVPMYQGIVISSLGISVCIGPVIGGALTEHTTWRTYLSLSLSPFRCRAAGVLTRVSRMVLLDVSRRMMLV